MDGGGIDEKQKEENLAQEMSSQRGDNLQVLLFNGSDDPFVSKEDLESYSESLTNSCVETNIKNYPDTRHGFTNPAQDLNPSEAFGYNEDAAKNAWDDSVNFFSKIF